MTLFEYYAEYAQTILEGQRPTPEGMVLTAEDEEGRLRQFTEQLAAMGMAEFVRRCARQDGRELPEEVFAGDDGLAGLQAALQQGGEAAVPEEAKAAEDDPDAGKHAFEVFLDCIALDDGLVRYLIDVLKRDDRKEFFKLSQITTKLDLDPEEFLYWLAHRQEYGSEEERVCAAVMDTAIDRLAREGRLEVAAALLSGDRKTFETFRCEAEELVHLPAATYEWYCTYYLDRDYPLRAILRLNGVKFPK